MKTVKLNRRFKMFREHGHTVALRFDDWSKDAVAIQKVCRARLNGGGWLREHDWYSGYGATRPYYITFRREADLTLVLLSANLTQNS